jgi:hypothetical protein
MLVLEDAPVRVPLAVGPVEISIARAMIDDFIRRRCLDPEDTRIGHVVWLGLPLL